MGKGRVDVFYSRLGNWHPLKGDFSEISSQSSFDGLAEKLKRKVQNFLVLPHKVLVSLDFLLIVVLSDVIIQLMDSISSFDGELVEIWMHLLHHIRIELVKILLSLNDHNTADPQHDVEVDR